MRSVRNRSRTRVVATAALVVFVVSVPASVVGLAASPAPPAAYYGEATINGEPLPAGTTIVAKIDGEIRGSITVDQAGTYGAAGGFEEKLTVNGSSSEAGATVTFHVGGLRAAETAEWSSGNITQLNLTFRDEQSPTAEAGSDRQAKVGEEVVFEASNSTDNGVVTKYRWGLGDGTSVSGQRVTHEYSEAGEYTVRLAVADAAGLTDTDSVTVTVVNPSDSGDDAEEGDESTGGGQGADSGREATIEQTSMDESVTVRFSDVPVGSSLSVDLDQKTLSNEKISLTAIEPAFTFDEEDFRLEIERPRSSQSGAALPDTVTGLSYIEIRHVGLSESSLESVRFHFTVNESALPDGATVADVAMYRKADGAWDRLNTTRITGDEFRATSPGLSLFAVVVEKPTETETSSATNEGSGSNSTSIGTETATARPQLPESNASSTPVSRTVPGFTLVTPVAVLLLLLLVIRHS